MGDHDELSSGTLFFKILMPGFHQRLKLPSAFCESAKHEKSKKAIVESYKGRWEMSVQREDDDAIFLEDGWPGFVDEHGLSLRDFIVFEHTAKLHFNVVICDSRTACEKQLLIDLPPKKVVNNNPAIKNPFFTVQMKRYTASNKGMVNIPAEFVRSNNLEKKRGVSLRDPRGRRWPIKLLVSRIRPSKRSMSIGWHDFYASNDIKVGDRCIFQLNSASATSATIFLDVKIISPLATVS